MANKLIIVVGSGPGIGAATASQFASQGFNVALLSRNAERLKEDAKQVSSASGDHGGKINTYPVDIGDHSALKSTLDKVKTEMGTPEVVLFNAARVAPSEWSKTPVERLTEDFQVMNVGLFVTAEWAIPLLEGVKEQDSSARPSFLITGGGIAVYPAEQFFALSMQKAAQYNFAGSLAQRAGPKGVHIATIRVNGPVADENPVINAKNVASKFWGLYGQEKDAWENVTDVGDFQ